MSKVEAERYWDERARENALYFVDNEVDYRDPDDDEFWRRGDEALDKMLAIVGLEIGGDDLIEAGVPRGPAVGRALDEVNRRGFSISSTLGRHTNDKMVSFYVRAPGDWDIEFGTDGMRVDETYYTAEEITADSYWGHEWVSDLPAAMRP
jgi:hypothetical protein